MRLSAAILAGGRSRRMGTDKALLPINGFGSLLERQLSILRALAPIELLLSCRPDQELPAAEDVRRIHDAGTTGPLGGIAACLANARGDALLVLGVDLAMISAALLRRIIHPVAIDETLGSIARTSQGIEPLASAFPRAALPLAQAQLEAGIDLSLRTFATSCVNAGLARWYEVEPSEERFLTNVNRPCDLTSDS